MVSISGSMTDPSSACAPWAEIDHGAIAWNVRVLRRRLAARVRLLAAVKADAYGHGAVAVARTVLQHGAQALGVVRLEEALALREASITAPILIFGPSPVDAAPELARHRLTPTISSAGEALALAAHLPAGATLIVHLKVDTGMGRLGAFAQDVTDPAALTAIVDEIALISTCPGLTLAGIYTHFASADATDGTQTKRQFAQFSAVLHRARQRGLDVGIRHAANSAGIIHHPHTHLDQVRSGIAIYGLSPGADTVSRIALRPALALKARIAQLKRVPPGTTIGYGETFRATREITVATVPIGYADGYDRAHGGRSGMLVRGQWAPIIGRVCMDFTMLDVSGIRGCALGDEVVAYGRQGALEIGIDEVAQRLGTIGYEVAATVAARVRRVHLPAPRPTAVPIAVPMTVATPALISA